MMRNLALTVLLNAIPTNILAGNCLDAFRECAAQSKGDAAALSEGDCSAKAIHDCTSQLKEPATGNCLLDLKEEMVSEQKSIFARLPETAPPDLDFDSENYQSLLSSAARGEDRMPCMKGMSAELCSAVSIEASWVEARFLARHVALPGDEEIEK